MFKRIRIILAAIFFIGITLLFADFTGALKAYLGWMAKLQFLPALLAGNVIVVGFLLVLTIFFGRVYCSVICPLGVFQDIFFALGIKAKRNRINPSPAKRVLRYSVLAIFILAIAFGVNSLVALIAPYSAYGRIAENIVAPAYVGINNLLAMIAERADSYTFYRTDVWVKGAGTMVVAIVTAVVLAVLAWRSGRTWCNTICPVGTILGFFSRFSLFRPVINVSKCVNCTKCAKNCKASCIDFKEHKIDYSRCVVCMDCLENCKEGAITYKWTGPKAALAPASGCCSCGVDQNESAKQKAENNASEKCNCSDEHNVDDGKRNFMAGAVALAGVVAAESLLSVKAFAQDGAMAAITPKEAPERGARLVPAGSFSVKRFRQHCTGCQLCVSKCPNGVLRPSTDLMTFMQPLMSFERGYCRPECTNCADVCPAGAIKPITVEEKSSIKIGTATVVAERCLEATGKDHCGKCSRSCPAGAISMLHSIIEDQESPKVPVVDAEKCIGCGKCENLCPVNPLSAIYVEGIDVHRVI